MRLSDTIPVTMSGSGSERLPGPPAVRRPESARTSQVLEIPPDSAAVLGILAAERLLQVGLLGEHDPVMDGYDEDRHEAHERIELNSVGCSESIMAD